MLINSLLVPFRFFFPGIEPSVRFDDEEDETDQSESVDPSPDSEDPDGNSYSPRDQAFRDATGLSLGRPRGDSEASVESGGINTTGGGSARKKQKSSLSRLNAYTKELSS